MPDVKVYMPGWHREDIQFTTDLQRTLCEAVAKYLDCNDHEGIPLHLVADDIDVMCFAYGDHDKVGAQLIIEVTGYDYPDRMANIEERLLAILRGGIPVSIPRIASGPKTASISYIRLGKGCFQSLP